MYTPSTRRVFLAAGAGTLAASAAGKKIGIERISAISDELARTPAAAIEFARKYGLRWLELRGVPGSRISYAGLPPAELKPAARQFADNGIRISYLDASLLKFGLPGTEPLRRTPEPEEAKRKREAREAEQFERRMDDLRKALDAAHILGVNKIRVFAFSRVKDPDTLLPRIADILNPMVEIAGKEKVSLLIENEGACNVATCAELARICRLVPSRWFGINWDTLNGTAFKEPAFPEGYALLPKKRIGNYHMKGRALLDGPQKQDWVAIFRAAIRDGYKGTFGLETHIDIGGPAQIPASHQCMEAIQKILPEV